MKRSIKATVSILLAGILLYAAVSRFGLPQTMAVIKAARPQLLLLGVVLMVLSFFLRAARWPIWERSLTNWNSFRLILIGFMGNNLLPARLGEILRAHCKSAKTSQDREEQLRWHPSPPNGFWTESMLGDFGDHRHRHVPMDQPSHGLLLVSLVFTALAEYWCSASFRIDDCGPASPR